MHFVIGLNRRHRDYIGSSPGLVHCCREGGSVATCVPSLLYRDRAEHSPYATFLAYYGAVCSRPHFPFHPPCAFTDPRTLYHSAARLKEAGQPFVKEAAMSKLYASQVRCLLKAGVSALLALFHVFVHIVFVPAADGRDCLLCVGY